MAQSVGSNYAFPELRNVGSSPQRLCTDSDLAGLTVMSRLSFLPLLVSLPCRSRSRTPWAIMRRDLVVNRPMLPSFTSPACVKGTAMGGRGEGGGRGRGGTRMNTNKVHASKSSKWLSLASQECRTPQRRAVEGCGGLPMIST